MATEQRTPVDRDLFPADERWDLLCRVAGSIGFQKSHRLRALLLFLGERALRTPQASLREQEIGAEVFGRPADYDTAQDNLVRVHVSQLRKKLQQYFSGEGRDEPVTIDLPRGSYIPVFVARPAAAAAPLPPRRPVVPWVLAAVLGMACAALLILNVQLQRRAQWGIGSNPTVDRLWQRMFANGQQTYLALSDGSLVKFQDEIRQSVSLGDYQSRAFDRLAEQRISDPARRVLPLSLLNRRYTSMADVGAAVKMKLVTTSNQLALDVILARDLTMAQLLSHNTILMGSRRANPWVGLFEDKLNFRTVFEENPRAAYFVNRIPAAGEAPVYRGDWGHLGYCRVAWLPNAKGTGSVLLISGTEVQMTEAGGEFITGEQWVRKLRASMGVTGSNPTPYFEALLKGQVVNKSVPQFQVIAWRKH